MGEDLGGVGGDAYRTGRRGVARRFFEEAHAMAIGSERGRGRETGQAFEET